jgi:hypothetical protein
MFFHRNGSFVNFFFFLRFLSEWKGKPIDGHYRESFTLRGLTYVHQQVLSNKSETELLFGYGFLCQKGIIISSTSPWLAFEARVFRVSKANWLNHGQKRWVSFGFFPH